MKLTQPAGGFPFLVRKSTGNQIARMDAGTLLRYYQLLSVIDEMEDGKVGIWRNILKCFMNAYFSLVNQLINGSKEEI